MKRDLLAVAAGGRFCCLLAGMLALSACSPKKTPSSARTSQPKGPVPVTVALARQTNVPVQLTMIGTVRAYATVSVKSRVDGQLQKIGFKDGDFVRKAELIFTIDPRPLEAAVGQAKAALTRDQALQKNAELNLKRNEELAKSQIVPTSDLDQARANAESASATVVADTEGVKNAELQLSYCYIKSPVDGRIGLIQLNVGNMVKNNDTTLGVVNQTKPIYVDFSVPEKNLPEIRQFLETKKLKTEATIPTQKNFVAEGALEAINNTVDPATGTILLRASFPNEQEKLWPGQFVNVALTLTTQSNAIVIPAEAIQTGQQGQFTFVVQPDATVEARPVVSGRQIGNEMVVEKGLNPKERVVTSGQMRLTAGARVQITTQGQKEKTTAGD